MTNENIVYDYVRESALRYAAASLVHEYPDATNKERMKHAQEAFDKGMERALGELAYYARPYSDKRLINAVKKELAYQTDDSDLGTEAGEELFNIIESEIPMEEE